MLHQLLIAVVIRPVQVPLHGESLLQPAPLLLVGCTRRSCSSRLYRVLPDTISVFSYWVSSKICVLMAASRSDSRAMVPA